MRRRRQKKEYDKILISAFNAPVPKLGSLANKEKVEQIIKDATKLRDDLQEHTKDGQWRYRTEAEKMVYCEVDSTVRQAKVRLQALNSKRFVKKNKWYELKRQRQQDKNVTVYYCVEHINPQGNASGVEVKVNAPKRAMRIRRTHRPVSEVHGLKKRSNKIEMLVLEGLSLQAVFDFAKKHAAKTSNHGPLYKWEAGTHKFKKCRKKNEYRWI